jgi:hypothetical protein
MVDRAIGVHENLFASEAYVFKLRQKSLEIACRQGEQEAIAGPIC